MFGTPVGSFSSNYIRSSKKYLISILFLAVLRAFLSSTRKNSRKYRFSNDSLLSNLSFRSFLSSFFFFFCISYRPAPGTILRVFPIRSCTYLSRYDTCALELSIFQFQPSCISKKHALSPLLIFTQNLWAKHSNMSTTLRVYIYRVDKTGRCAEIPRYLTQGT